MAGKSIIDLDIRAQYGINIIAIKRGKEFIISPNPNINLEIGDILIMIGHDNDLNRFEKYCDEIIIGSGTEMIFSQNLFRRPTQLPCL